MIKNRVGKDKAGGAHSRDAGGAGVHDILDKADALEIYLEREGADSVTQLMLFMDTLKEAVVSLVTGDLERAALSMKRLGTIATSELFRGIGEITRDHHESIREIQRYLDPLVNDIGEYDIQALSSKLAHVSSLVSEASEKTLDLLFARQELALADNAAFDAVAGLIVSGDKKGALLKLKDLKSHNADLVGRLMSISELQIHADLVDQIIRKVSRAVDEMQGRLVELIRKYGDHHPSPERAAPAREPRLHGPAVPGDPAGAVTTQGGVDELLESFSL